MRKKAELFDTLNKVLNQYAQSTKSVEPKTDSKIVFKMPIEGHVENIGAYSPGARTDARHTHHDGVDLHAPRGTKAFSIAPGVVTSINSDAVGGNNIVITHDQGYKSYYAHLDSISDEAIKYYLDNYQPFDKAGSYGIQDWIGLVGISKIEGSYTNVVGLPTEMLFQKLMNQVIFL